MGNLTRISGSLIANYSSSITGTGSFGRLQLDDGNKAVFGSDDDGNIKHTGTNLQIQETTGNIQLINYANDKDISLQTDDGSGGTTAYITLDGSTTKVEVAKDTNFAGNVSGSLTSTGSFGSLNATHLNGILEGTLGPVANALISGSTVVNAPNISGSITSTGSFGSLVVVDKVQGDLDLGGSITAAGDISTSGSIFAREFHTEFTSASVVFASGSNKFGDDSGDTHRFTGSMLVSGSITMADGDLSVTDNLDVSGNVTGSITSTGSFASAHFMGTGGVGIGTDSPTGQLTIASSTSPSLTFKDTGGGTDSKIFKLAGGGDAFFFEGRNDADSDAGDVGGDGAIMAFSLTTGNVSIGKSSTVDTDRLFVTDGASPYAGANRMMQIKRDATNGNDTTSFASLLIGNNSNGFVIGYGGTTDRFRFLDGSGTERVSFANGGNVGIGTSAPSGALHVNGANPTVFITNSTQDGASTLLRMTERKEVDGNAGAYLLYNGSQNRFEIGTNISGTDTNHITLPRDQSGFVGIGELAPSAPLEVANGSGAGQGSIGYTGTMIACSSASADEYSDSNSATWGPKINISNETASSTRTAASLVFAHRSGSSGVAAIVSTNTATDRADLRFITRGTGNVVGERMRLTDDGTLIIGDVSNANMTKGLTINQGANDDEIFCLKSSDVNHGHTNSVEADTFMRIHKHAAGTGGARIDAFSEAGVTPGMEINGYSQGTDNTRSTSGTANVIMAAIGMSGGNPADLAGDKNILVIRNRNTTRFVFDTDGDLFADNNVSSEAFDTYQDAHLLRTFDLSHGRGVIQSKFDDFIKYQHETLASLKLVGREKDGTPNHFVNVTGMQRLHNGAIWQQYTEMEKMKELMYDTMVQLLGKETADKKLEQHDIKLLDESLDVTDSLWSKVKNKAKSLFKIIK